MKYHEKLLSIIIIQFMIFFNEYRFASDEVKYMGKNNVLEDGYISIDEAAEYLGIKTVTLRNWIKKKPELPAHRVGKLWKFKRSELDAWVASGKSAE